MSVVSTPSGLGFKVHTTSTNLAVGVVLFLNPVQNDHSEIARNVKKVLEMLIDGDGEWDALVVERDTPVMDSFQIASTLRDFEKARRNRASTVRAAAVERHANGVGGGTTRGHGIERDTGGKCRFKHRYRFICR